jgi:hypothetical protein
VHDGECGTSFFRHESPDDAQTRGSAITHSDLANDGEKNLVRCGGNFLLVAYDAVGLQSQHFCDAGRVGGSHLQKRLIGGSWMRRGTELKLCGSRDGPRKAVGCRCVPWGMSEPRGRLGRSRCGEKRRRGCRWRFERLCERRPGRMGRKHEDSSHDRSVPAAYEKRLQDGGATCRWPPSLILLTRSTRSCANRVCRAAARRR